MKKNPSMAEIAKKAGVCKTTVSMSLRDDPRISPAQRLRVRKIAADMGYQTNALVSRLMYELRTSRQQGHRATLALVNCSQNPVVRKRSGAFNDWCLGVEQRAAQLGYTVDPFWMHEPGITPERLQKIFRARNILGVVFYALEGTSALREYQAVWSRFPCVTIGTRVRTPALHFVVNDHFSTSHQAVLALHELGYAKIGLIIDQWQNQMLESRFVGGWRTALETLSPQTLVLPPLFLQGYLARDQESEKRLLSDWLAEHRPDVCLTLNVQVHDWLEKLGYRMPGQIGVARLDLTKGLRGKMAGMEQQHLRAGMAATDMLVGQILRRETGVPPFQQGILIESVWCPGPTVRQPPSTTRSTPGKKLPPPTS